MNQNLKASGSLMISVPDWCRIKYLLGVGMEDMRQCTSTVHCLKADLSQVAIKARTTKNRLRLIDLVEIRKFQETFGTASIAGVRNKFPSLRRLRKGDVLIKGVSALRRSDWVNVVTPDLVQTEISSNLFQYNTPHNGIDLTYYCSTNKLRVSIRFAKRSGDDQFLGTLFKLERSGIIPTNFSIKIGDQFEMGELTFEVRKFLENREQLECYELETNDIQVLPAAMVKDLVRAYLA